MYHRATYGPRQGTNSGGTAAIGHRQWVNMILLEEVPGISQGPSDTLKLQTLALLYLSDVGENSLYMTG